MLTKTISEAKKKQRNILIKAMNNDIGSIDSAKDSWNPAQISERAKDISYIRSLVDTWNPAQLNEALKMLDLPVIDTWNPAQIEEQRRNLVFYLSYRTLTGNPITLKILGNLTPEVTGLKVTMNPIQNLHGYSNPWAGGAGKNKCNPLLLLDQVGWTTFTIQLKANTQYTMSSNISQDTTGELPLYFLSGSATPGSGTLVYSGHSVTMTSDENGEVRVQQRRVSGTDSFQNYQWQIEEGNQTTDFAPYSNICPISGRTETSVTRTAGEDVETKTHNYGQTVWWATDDFLNGGADANGVEISSYDGETITTEWMSDRDVYAPDTTPTIGAQVVYKSTPETIETTAEELTLLKGTNVLSTDGDFIELKYKQNF